MQNKTTYSKQEIIEILNDKNSPSWLFPKANKVRQENVGDEIHLRALIEISNICKNSCQYCGLRKENKSIERYKIDTKEIVSFVKNAVNLGYKTIVLQSGEANNYSTKELCEIIEKIKQFDVAVTLSIGEKTFEEYKAYKNAGADRYLLRIETTDKKLYQKMHPNMNFENRIECLNNLKQIGYEVGTGSLIGLPEQTIESIADDILFFKKIDADMIGIGPFIPHAQTPLKNAPKGNFVLALKVMAITRILLPNINIPATTAMETIQQNGRVLALQSGANVIMPNVADIEYRKKYEIYPNKSGTKIDAQTYHQEIINLILSLNRTISKDYGFRKNHNSIK